MWAALAATAPSLLAWNPPPSPTFLNQALALSLVVVPQGGITNWLGPRIAITYARGGPAPLRRFVFRAAAGFARLTLLVGGANTAARRLYARVGFQPRAQFVSGTCAGAAPHRRRRLPAA